MDADFLRILREAVDNNETVVLVTVVEARGSTPREAGAKMLIFQDGRTFGTVGGGAIEKRVMEGAHKLFKEGGTRLIHCKLKEDLNMKCGGEVSVYLEKISGARRLVIFGGGHIGQALYTLSPLLGMTPVIVDERPEFCNPTRFPRAELLPLPPKDAVGRLNLDSRDHVVIVTHRHENDLESLRLVVGLPVGYLGMIGSRKKVAGTIETLRSEGTADEHLRRVRAPIGLNLGGRTPGEIAVAIAAEIIALSRGRKRDELEW